MNIHLIEASTDDPSRASLLQRLKHPHAAPLPPRHCPLPLAKGNCQTCDVFQLIISPRQLTGARSLTDLNKPHPVSGSCLCGKITLNIDALNRDVVACHCKQCQQQTGHYVAATRAENTHLHVEGEEHLKWYRSSEEAERGFCRHCGSLLLWRRIDSLHTSIMAGCLDSPTGLRLTRHIYTDDKGDYYELDPAIEAFSQSD